MKNEELALPHKSKQRIILHSSFFTLHYFKSSGTKVEMMSTMMPITSTVMVF